MIKDTFDWISVPTEKKDNRTRYMIKQTEREISDQEHVINKFVCSVRDITRRKIRHQKFRYESKLNRRSCQEKIQGNNNWNKRRFIKLQ